MVLFDDDADEWLIKLGRKLDRSYQQWEIDMEVPPYKYLLLVLDDVIVYYWVGLMRSDPSRL